MQPRQFVAGVLRRSALAAGLSLLTAFATAQADEQAFIPRLINSSTIPANGDVNPMELLSCRQGFPSGGKIAAGDMLVSNFNNSANLQGTGTTIIQLRPTGALAPPGNAVTFFTRQQPGLSTALGVLRSGFVIVGNVPTKTAASHHRQRCAAGTRP